MRARERMKQVLFRHCISHRDTHISFGLSLMNENLLTRQLRFQFCYSFLAQLPEITNTYANWDENIKKKNTDFDTNQRHLRLA